MIRIIKSGINERSDVFSVMTNKIDVSETVGKIIADVAKNGDKALYKYNEQFDGAVLNSLEVTSSEFEEAASLVPENFVRILQDSARNIREFHLKQVREGFVVERANGVKVGQKIVPIEKVGLYVPGGTAAYPSTVLMDAIPAKIAGCREIVMVTPPNKDGKINPYILVAAAVAGVDKVFKVGGAQAVAALSYGTETIPKVYKIVGPGNAFVAEAKKQVFGMVSIDMIAGPSEILVISDGLSNPGFVAADLLSQAEHDKNASAVLVTDSEDLANKVALEIERQIPLLKRRDIARASIDNNGKIIVVDSIDKAVEIANEIAPEHLELSVKNPMDYLDKVKNAGSVFLGEYCPEAVGDYYAGTNHTLPTSGSAKFSSALSVDDFVKKVQYIYYGKDELEKVYKDVDAFAQAEGLTAHGKSVTVRFSKD
ncbi:MAG: histidinol dehydrogenase [Christensenellaceae bacterium]